MTTIWGHGVQYGRQFGRTLADSDLRETIDAYLIAYNGEQDEDFARYLRGVMFGLEAEMGRRQVILAAYNS